jgi:hypothetical protein
MDDALVVYWGDCDEAGHGILSGLRSVFPQVRSVLMDECSVEALSAHRRRASQGD